MPTNMRENLGPSRKCSPELAAYLRHLRQNAEVATLDLAPGKRPTQLQVAYGIGVTPDLYRKMEGADASVTRATVMALEKLYNLTDQQRENLYLLALGWKPDIPAQTRASSQSRSVALVDLVAHPAALLDPTWQILHPNGEFAQWWQSPMSSFAEGILCSSAIRARLIDWETSWARPVLAEIYLAQWVLPLAFRPRLTDLVDRVTADDQVKQIWRSLRTSFKETPRLGFADLQCPHGSVRRIRIDEVEPAQLPHHRIVTLVPLEVPPCCPAAPRSALSPTESTGDARPSAAPQLQGTHSPTRRRIVARPVPE